MDKNVLEVEFTPNDLSNNLLNYPNWEWIVAGIKIMRDHGIHHISVKSICDGANKTEQEFLESFKNLELFLFTVLDYWYEKETIAYIDVLDDMVGNAEENILNLVEILHNADKRDDVAIRNWALKCPHARAALEKVDRTRLDVGVGLFKEMGFSEKESVLRTKFLYSSSIGTEYTSIIVTLEQKIAMCELLMDRS